MGTMTDYERIGGEAGLRRVVEAFVDRFYDDFIIGFLFVGRDKAKIARHEAELAAAHLGGPRRYAGRPLGEAHGPLKINRGHFRRRLAILEHVLREQGVPEDVIARWVAHDRRLERIVTTGVDCVP